MSEPNYDIEAFMAALQIVVERLDVLDREADTVRDILNGISQRIDMMQDKLLTHDERIYAMGNSLSTKLVKENTYVPKEKTAEEKALIERVMNRVGIKK